MSRLIPLAYQPLDVNGTPYPGALLYCYQTASVVPQNTWSVEASIGGGANLNANPVVADANGRFGPVFGDGSAYALALKTAAGVVIWTADPVYGEVTKYPTTTLAGTSSGATAAVAGTNSSTGAGVHAKNTGTGYALISEGDATAPAKGCHRMVPQDADPTVPLQGENYVNSVDGKLSGYNGGSWLRYIGQLFSLGGTEQIATTGGTDSFSSVTIPANTLRVGSTIRVKAKAFVQAQVGGPAVTLAIGTLAQTITCALASAAAGDMFSLEFDLTFLSVGAGGQAIFTGVGLSLDGGVAANTVENVQVAINTTLANNIICTVTRVGATSATVELVQLSVDLG